MRESQTARDLNSEFDWNAAQPGTIHYEIDFLGQKHPLRNEENPHN
jgi:hypothetical protein